jgi:hypothetical protein
MKDISSEEMLAKLKEQERRIIESDSLKIQDMEIKLHPKIDVEECLRNGYISADDYRKTHNKEKER